MTIDIAVISQFRPKFLEKCLKSIAKQTRIPDSVILVLSSKDKKSMALLEKFENLPIKVFYYDKRGYAFLRNIALKAGKSDFLYFVDDDCILDKEAVEQALGFFTKNPNFSAVQGKTKNIDTSFYSQFASWTNELWLQRAYDQKKKLLKVIDTKNVCLRIKAVDNLKFNECLGSEDVDFGLQISRRGGKIGWETKIKALHYEQANTFLSYFLKRLRMFNGLKIVKKKWGNLPIFYEDNKTFNQKITAFFNKSNYSHSYKYKLVLKLFLYLRNIKYLLDVN